MEVRGHFPKVTQPLDGRMNPALPDVKPAGRVPWVLAAESPSPGMRRPRTGEGTHSFNEEGLGRTSRGRGQGDPQGHAPMIYLGRQQWLPM